MEILGDFLSIYINQGKKNPSQSYLLDDEYLFEMVLNMMVAGRDTTSCLNTNLFKYLATNEDAQKKLIQEMKAQNVSSSFLSLEMSRKLPYASAVVNESLRILPPVPNDFRFCQQDEVLPSGIKVKSGMQVFIPIWGIGRDPHLFHNPDDFIPDRWLPARTEEGEIRRPDEYICPFFWGGPRLCLGHAMATFETITFITKVVPELKVIPIPNQNEDLVTGPVGFYQNGMKVKVELR